MERKSKVPLGWQIHMKTSQLLNDINSDIEDQYLWIDEVVTEAVKTMAVRDIVMLPKTPTEIRKKQQRKNSPMEECQFLYSTQNCCDTSDLKKLHKTSVQHEAGCEHQDEETVTARSETQFKKPSHSARLRLFCNDEDIQFAVKCDNGAHDDSSSVSSPWPTYFSLQPVSLQGDSDHILYNDGVQQNSIQFEGGGEMSRLCARRNFSDTISLTSAVRGIASVGIQVDHKQLEDESKCKCRCKHVETASVAVQTDDVFVIGLRESLLQFAAQQLGHSKDSIASPQSSYLTSKCSIGDQFQQSKFFPAIESVESSCSELQQLQNSTEPISPPFATEFGSLPETSSDTSVGCGDDLVAENSTSGTSLAFMEQPKLSRWQTSLHLCSVTSDEQVGASPYVSSSQTQPPIQAESTRCQTIANDVSNCSDQSGMSLAIERSRENLLMQTAAESEQTADVYSSHRSFLPQSLFGISAEIQRAQEDSCNLPSSVSAGLPFSKPKRTPPPPPSRPPVGVPYLVVDINKRLNSVCHAKSVSSCCPKLTEENCESEQKKHDRADHLQHQLIEGGIPTSNSKQTGHTEAIMSANTNRQSSPTDPSTSLPVLSSACLDHQVVESANGKAVPEGARSVAPPLNLNSVVTGTDNCFGQIAVQSLAGGNGKSVSTKPTNLSPGLSGQAKLQASADRNYWKPTTTKPIVSPVECADGGTSLDRVVVGAVNVNVMPDCVKIVLPNTGETNSSVKGTEEYFDDVITQAVSDENLCNVLPEQTACVAAPVKGKRSKGSRGPRLSVGRKSLSSKRRSGLHHDKCYSTKLSRPAVWLLNATKSSKKKKAKESKKIIAEQTEHTPEVQQPVATTATVTTMKTNITPSPASALLSRRSISAPSLGAAAQVCSSGSLRSRFPNLHKVFSTKPKFQNVVKCEMPPPSTPVVPRKGVVVSNKVTVSSKPQTPVNITQAAVKSKLQNAAGSAPRTLTTTTSLRACFSPAGRDSTLDKPSVVSSNKVPASSQKTRPSSACSNHSSGNNTQKAAARVVSKVESCTSVEKPTAKRGLFQRIQDRMKARQQDRAESKTPIRVSIDGSGKVLQSRFHKHSGTAAGSFRTPGQSSKASPSYQQRFQSPVSKISAASSTASRESPVAKQTRPALNETFDTESDRPPLLSATNSTTGQTGGTQPYCSLQSSPAGSRFYSPHKARLGAQMHFAATVTSTAAEVHCNAADSSMVDADVDDENHDYSNYDINDICSDDSTDDESAPRKILPLWAQEHGLKEALQYFYHNPIDVVDLFGVICPPDLNEMFDVKKDRFDKRTSSANWDIPICCTHELSVCGHRATYYY